MADFWWSSLFLILFLLQHREFRAQQSYVNNKQLNCEQNDTVTLGYVCNGVSSCQSYLTFRSTLIYNNPVSIAYLLSADPSQISRLNNISDVAPLPPDTLVVVPLNCSCSGAGNGSTRYYQHSSSYVLKDATETYFTVANNTYQSLTTCQSMIAQNTYNYRRLLVGERLKIPLWCACPTSNQSADDVKYLLTYLISRGDTYSTIAEYFSRAGADVQGILDANKLSLDQLIFFFTPILVPLNAEPTKDRIRYSVSAPPPAQPAVPVARTGNSSRNHKGVFIGLGIGLALLLLIVVTGLLIWFLRYRPRRHQYLPPTEPPSLIKKLADESAEKQPSLSWSVSSDRIQNAIENLTIYKFEELQKATDSFAEANKISESVYRGKFKGDEAAVKITKGEVFREIEVLRQINHSHIVRLSGFCQHLGATYLVCEYAERGSLHDLLHRKKGDDNSLDWKQRVQLAYDVADALNYLHSFSNPPYIYKNLKGSNILVDGNMRAKLTNFSQARNVDVEEESSGPQVMTRHVVGTYGYMAPEYIQNGLVTPKLDVFAFGVVMLELLSGREAISDGEGESLLSVAIEEVLAGEKVTEKLRKFIDPGLKQEYPLQLAYSFAQLANECVSHDFNARPTMAQVSMALTKLLSSS